MEFESKIRLIIPEGFLESPFDVKRVFEAIGHLVWYGSRWNADEINIGPDSSCGGKSFVAYYHREGKLVFALGAVERNGEYSYHS